MLDEQAYLTFNSGAIPEGPWLVVAPHPDDETFGLAGSLLLAAEQKIPVDILFLTSGDKGGPEGIATIREAEAFNACRLLGIREITFWRLPDRGLSINPAIIDRLAELIESIQASTVFFPSPVEPHPDHRAACVIAWEALRKAEFTAAPWSYEISVQGPVNQLIDITQKVEHKREIMSVYTSQLTQNHYIERVLGLNQARAWSLPMEASHAEGFFAWPKDNRPINALLMTLQLAQCNTHALPSQTKTVSVIIRTKNRPELLTKAISSVATQTYENIELVVLNDGGIEVGEIVKEYAIGSISKIIHESFETPKGRTETANAGLDLATGEYFIFLDDDDWFTPEHIAKLVAAHELYPDIIVAYTDAQQVDVDGNLLGQFMGPFPNFSLIFGNQFPIHAALIKKTIIQAHCCRFDPNFELFEDWDFWLQLQSKGRFQHVPGASAVYVIYECGSGVHTTSGTRTLNYLNIRNKWRSLWPDSWLEATFEEIQKVPKLENQLAVIDQQHARLITESQNLAVERDELNAQRHKLTYELDELIAKYTNLLIQYNTLTSERDELLSERNTLSNRCYTLMTNLDNCSHHASQLEHQLKNLLAEHTALMNTVSWRLTAPLRFLKRQVNRI